jgi:hypothetical protein
LKSGGSHEWLTPHLDRGPVYKNPENDLAISAYNLVRAVMCLAARRANLSPRQLSFSFVLDVVNAVWPRHAEFDRLLDYAVSYKLPKRKKWRSYPRAVWGRGATFPNRKAQPDSL